MNVDSLTYIDLFAGVSMLGLGFEAGLDYLGVRAQCVTHVEREVFAAGVMAARMQDGSLTEAPIFSDVCAFDGLRYRDQVDAVIGGFPCQDLSVAGKQSGIDGEKSGLWREYARIIREVRPRLVFIENVPGLLANEPMRRVLGDLSALGFDAEWGVFSAAGVGAPHKRERVFILAVSQERDGSHGEGGRRRGVCEAGDGVGNPELPRTNSRPTESGPRDSTCQPSRSMADAERTERRAHNVTGGYRREGIDGQGQAPSGTGERGESLGDSTGARCCTGQPGASGEIRDGARRPEPDGRCGVLGDTIGSRRTEAGIGCDQHTGSEFKAGRGSVENHECREREQSSWIGAECGQTCGAGPHGEPSGSSLFPPEPSDREGWSRMPAYLAPAVESGFRMSLDGHSDFLDCPICNWAGYVRRWRRRMSDELERMCGPKTGAKSMSDVEDLPSMSKGSQSTGRPPSRHRESANASDIRVPNVPCEAGSIGREEVGKSIQAQDPESLPGLRPADGEAAQSILQQDLLSEIESREGQTESSANNRKLRGLQESSQSKPRVLQPIVRHHVSKFAIDASRTDQLRAGGNGVVAISAAVALVTLARRAGIA